MGLGTGVAVLNSQVVPISQVVAKTGFTVILQVSESSNDNNQVMQPFSIATIMSVSQSFPQTSIPHSIFQKNIGGMIIGDNIYHKKTERTVIGG